MECGRQRRILAKAATRMRNMHLRHAFEGWRESVLISVHSMSQATHICQKLLARSFMKAFRAWHECTCELKAARAQAEQVILWLQQSTLAEAFRSWQKLAANLRSAKAAARVLFTRAGKLDLSRVTFHSCCNLLL